MSQNNIHPVIIAGGSGSRLWPLSRTLYPKQFLRLDGESSMLQSTICRLNGLNCFPPLVICNEKHRFIVAEQLQDIGQLTGNIILEPLARNTAPAIALAAISACNNNPDQNPLLLILAADHIIEENKHFHDAVISAIPLAEKGKLVTFGIVPDAPETGYGYIRRGEVSSTQTKVDSVAFNVDAFVEKPDLETAEKYISDGEYYWNSGMFLFQARRYLEELEKYRPDILQACLLAMDNAELDNDFIRVGREDFHACPEESIDYAVMEKTTDAVVLPMNVGWSDVGS